VGRSVRVRHLGSFLYFSDTGVITAALTLEIVVEYPHVAVLEADADIAKPAGHFRPSFLYHDAQAPSREPLMDDLVAYLKVERILLFHGERIYHPPTRFKGGGSGH
jgi:hypothetical protein